MKTTIHALKMKLAWQEAWRARSCPDDNMLFAEIPSDEVKRHITLCPACASALTSVESRQAWRTLTQRLFNGSATHHRATDVKPVDGQVWALKNTLCHWRDDGSFYRPPKVLLLGVDENSLKAAQLFHDTTLAADGDVLLSNKLFGFAQAWNIYTIHKDMLDHCLGVVKHQELLTVLGESVRSRVDIDANSILYWFRTNEVMVGAEIAVPAVAQLMEEMEACPSKNEAFLQQMFGTLADAYRKLSEYRLPEPNNSLLGLFFGVRDPNASMPVLAATTVQLQINVVIKQQDGAITIKTVGATLMESNWEDGDYYVDGKLDEAPQEDLFLVASLNVGGSVVSEWQDRIEKGSPYFYIHFKSVTKEASLVTNLQFILVKS